MLRSLEELELIKGMAHGPPFKPGAGFEIEASPQSNMTQPMGHTEPRQAARRVDRQETMIALRPYRPGRRFGKRRMALERLVKGLHVPPFLVDCDDVFCIAIEVAASQIQNSGAAIPVSSTGQAFVCKDLADEENWKVQPPQVATHRLTFRQVQRV